MCKLQKLLAVTLTLFMLANVAPVSALTTESVVIVVGHTDGIVYSNDVYDAAKNAGLYVYDEGYGDWLWTEIPFAVIFSPGVAAIGDGAFASSAWLTSVDIPDGVKSIGALAFAHCFLLAEINIPDSVTSIGEYAFSWCESLTSVVIPDGVTNIEEGLFCQSVSLADVAIGRGVNRIGDFAFYGCSSLVELILPDSVSEIGTWAFGFCLSLAKLTIPDSVTEIGMFALHRGDYNPNTTRDPYPLPGLTIYGDDESMAHDYAVKNGIPFHSLGDIPNPMIPTPRETFVSATNITGIPTTAMAGTSLTLTGIVNPSTATNQTITWSVASVGATGATITNGNCLNTSAAGTVRIRATITNGLAASSDYTQEFNITVRAALTPAATITKVTVTRPSANVQTGKTTAAFRATVTGTNNPVQTVRWTVSGNKNSGTRINSAGRLTVHRNETAVTLTIRATSTVDTRIYDTATVSIKRTTALKTAQVPRSQTVKRGGKITLRAPAKTTLYYTTNGRNPTIRSTKVNAGRSRALTIRKNTTVKVFAVRTGCRPSATATRNYKVR